MYFQSFDKAPSLLNLHSCLSRGRSEKIKKKYSNLLHQHKGCRKTVYSRPGIRHTSRPRLFKPCSLHLTVKVKKIKAEIKNKAVLSILKRAILNARGKGLRVIHYSLEYDHVHLLIEAENNHVLGKGMQAFGVTFSKAINRMQKLKGGVYKHRYHFRRISSSRELKNVLNYIFTNGLKHKTSKSIINPYNSIKAEMKYFLFFKGKLELDLELMRILDKGKVFYLGLGFA